jgi:prevent-host-death family protein
MNVSATEAKNQLGRMLEQCQRQPVVIEKSGRRHSVLLSAAHYDELMQAQGKSVAPRDAGKAFAATYAAWVAEQQRHFETHGTWNDEFRSW